MSDKDTKKKDTKITVPMVSFLPMTRNTRVMEPIPKRTTIVRK